MPSVKSVLAASAVVFFASANGHMVLKTPPPYGNPNNSPLDPSGSDFPCKSTSNAGGPVTNMAIGSKQQLSFTGSAVHGGGSCQVALTTDNPATKNSKWMVIHSIVGGCPARQAAGNIAGGPGGSGADKYDYTIPQGIAPGKYTLAWTWFNKIGNREMYNNCANIMVTGGSGKRDVPLNETDAYGIPELSERATPNFPPLFTANIGNGCKTADSVDLAFPNPGPSIEKAGSGPTAPPTGNCAASGTSASSSGGSSSSSGSSSGGVASGSGSSSGSGSGSGAAPAASPAAGGSGSAGGAPSADGSSGSSSGVDSQANVSGASSGSSSSGSSGSSGGAAAAPSAPAGGASGAAAPSSGSAAPSSAAGSGSSPDSGSSAPAPASAAAAPVSPVGGAATGTCSTPGQSICSPDGKQIGTCTQQKTVTWIPVSAGTKCSGGMMVHANSKRSVRFPVDYKFGQ